MPLDLKSPLRVKILGRVWSLHFTPLRGRRGDIDPPEARKKQIRIATRLKGEERLEVIVHELVHAAGWHIDEEFVEQFGRDVARVLWRLGYREDASA